MSTSETAAVPRTVVGTAPVIGAGLGLGLSIAYKIVHDFSGSLKAANRDGGGAVFTMRLPVADEHVLAAE